MGDVSFSVELQEPISYSLYILITGLALIAVALVVFFIFWKRWVNFQNGVKSPPRVKKKKPIVLSYVRAKYLRQIARLEKGLAEEKVSARIAYQELSRIIRAFVHEATGLDVQNYSYTEIKVLNIPGLTSLVESYYQPEFARGTTEEVSPTVAQNVSAGVSAMNTNTAIPERADTGIVTNDAVNKEAASAVNTGATTVRRISPSLLSAVQNTKGVITSWR